MPDPAPLPTRRPCMAHSYPRAQSFLAVFVFTQRSCYRGMGVRRSVNWGFWETAAWVQTNFNGKLPIHHISRPLFSRNFNYQICTILFKFSLTWDPMIAKISKGYFSHSFGPISTKLHDKYVRGWRYFQTENCMVLGIFILTQDYMGLEISKHYFDLQFSLISARLYNDIVYHVGIQATLSSVWGHSVQFAKVSMLRLSLCPLAILTSFRKRLSRT